MTVDVSHFEAIFLQKNLSCSCYKANNFNVKWKYLHFSRSMFKAIKGAPFRISYVHQSIPLGLGGQGVDCSFLMHICSDRCRKVIELARKYKLLVISDDVYNLLYHDKPPTRLFSYDTKYKHHRQCVD